MDKRFGEMEQGVVDDDTSNQASVTEH